LHGLSLQLRHTRASPGQDTRKARACLWCALVGAGLTLLAQEGSGPYPWLKKGEAVQGLESRIAPPAGCSRVPVSPGSFAAWLRGLPLKPGRPQVLLYNGQPKRRQDVHEAVVAMDVGPEDLQQCADAIIRLRAEFLWASGKARSIRFNFTNGEPAEFSRWSEGYRPVVQANGVTWVKRAKPDGSYESFRRYLTVVFRYAGSDSLDRELKSVGSVPDIRGGDVFIHGGFPGHAVLVVDVAESPRTGRKLFLLAQSYMPAQEVHVLKNFERPDLSPWYAADFGETLVTPEWTFAKSELRRIE
jgi:hypothetical protein